MNLVKVDEEFFELCESKGADARNQLLRSETGRPCVLVIKLKYRGEKRDFIVPMKSNITPQTDKETYFALPPNKRTKDGNFHGISYIKIFPIDKKYVKPYRFDKDKYLCGVKKIIDANTKEIIDACQQCLDKYEKGERNAYTPDIGAIIDLVLWFLIFKFYIAGKSIDEIAKVCDVTTEKVEEILA